MSRKCLSRHVRRLVANSCWILPVWRRKFFTEHRKGVRKKKTCRRGACWVISSQGNWQRRSAGAGWINLHFLCLGFSDTSYAAWMDWPDGESQCLAWAWESKEGTSRSAHSVFSPLWLSYCNGGTCCQNQPRMMGGYANARRTSRRGCCLPRLTSCALTRLAAIRPSSTNRNSYSDVYCQLLFIRLQKLSTSSSPFAALAWL